MLSVEINFTPCTFPTICTFRGGWGHTNYNKKYEYEFYQTGLQSTLLQQFLLQPAYNMPVIFSQF